MSVNFKLSERLVDQAILWQEARCEPVFRRAQMSARAVFVCCFFLSTAVLAQTAPAPAGFDCYEPTQGYVAGSRNPLFTKLVGTTFSLKVVALDSQGKPYTYPSPGKVTYQLIDEANGPACAPTSGLATSAVMSGTFTPTINTGTVAITSGIAFSKLRCRATDITTGVSSCSSDTFSIRPTAITKITSYATASADAAGVNASTSTARAVKAGMPFTLQAMAGSGYTGLPKVNPALIQWNGTGDTPASGWPVGGRVGGVGKLDGFNGGSVGNLQFEKPATSPKDPNGAFGTFTYDEVGYFQFLPNGVYDDTFSDVSKDATNGDCVVGSDSNTLVNNRYGCSFGNDFLSDHFGRFIPDHFVTEVTQGGGQLGTFTYNKQPFVLTVTAKNLTGGTTQNYTGGSFSKNTTLSVWDATNAAATSADARGALSSPANFSGVNFNGGPVGGAGGVAKINTLYAFTTLPSEPANLWVRAIDVDQVSSTNTLTPGLYEAILPIRSGRATMTNSFGPETLDLNVYFRTEYWSNGAWITNTDDQYTGDDTRTVTGTIPAGITSNSNAVSVALTPQSTPLITTCVIDAQPSLSGAGCTSAGANVLKRFKKGIPSGTSADFAGDFNLWLQAPGAGKRGNLIVSGKVPQWLGTPVSATVNFGVRLTPWIYRREVYR